MKVGEVKDNSVRQVVEADIVVEELRASVDHFDIVEFRFIHGFKHWNSYFDSL